MNNERRRLLKKSVLVPLEQIRKSLLKVLQEEEYSLENIPENLQTSEQYENIEYVIASLELCVDKLDEVKDELEDIVT